MEPNELNQKLDFLSQEDLGVAYDPELTWSKLERKINSSQRDIYIKLLVAACAVLLILALPFSVSDQSKPIVYKEVTAKSAFIASTELEAISDKLEKKKYATEFKPLLSKSVEVSLAEPQLSSRSLTPRYISKNYRKEQQFAAQDISAIQASLESSTAETKSALVKARLFASTNSSAIDYQSLKIKINEKE